MKYIVCMRSYARWCVHVWASANAYGGSYNEKLSQTVRNLFSTVQLKLLRLLPAWLFHLNSYTHLYGSSLGVDLIRICVYCVLCTVCAHQRICSLCNACVYATIELSIFFRLSGFIVLHIFKYFMIPANENAFRLLPQTGRATKRRAICWKVG